ncbi:MAG TPA: hypothetical protein VFX15_10200, partial [Actinomycetes bacterium]|nr:hypothetical protein [Actinomycetes bacterium]
DPAALPPTLLTVRDVEAAEAARLEDEWIGWDRIDQYRFWSTRPGARTVAVIEGTTPVAVGCLSRSRTRFTLLHLATVEASYIRDAVRAVCALASGDTMLAAPGMSAVVPWLLDAGWRVREHDLYCASEPELFAAECLIPHPGLL